MFIKIEVGLRLYVVPFVIILTLLACGTLTPKQQPTLTQSIPLQLTPTAQITLQPSLASTNTTTSQPTIPSSDLLQVYYFDVGQGDSILVIAPDGKTMLIDGGEIDTGIVQYLQGMNIQRIDVMVATHPNSDHIGGLVQVLEAIPWGGKQCLDTKRGHCKVDSFPRVEYSIT